MLFRNYYLDGTEKGESMTARNKKITWGIVGTMLVALVLSYIFIPSFHSMGNRLLGRSEKEFPKPDSLKVDEYEYGAPAQEFKTEHLDVPRDSLLDSIMLGDSTMMPGQVMPVDGPPPTPIPGFGDGPLPPELSESDIPSINAERATPKVTPVVIDEVEHHDATNASLNAKLTACRNNYTKLVDLYNEYVVSPTSEMQEIGTKRRSDLLTELSQLMKAAQSANDDNCLEEVANMRRQVNKIKF